METLLKNLKKYVECSICLDTFTEPKTIACLHTFCCKCIKKHALVSQKDGQFRCPQAQITIPEGNRFDQLPTSFHHNSLLGLLAVQRSGDGKEISCGLCKKNSAEISFCFDCEKLLCSDCVNAHELFKTAAFEGHKVTPVKQFQAEDYEALLQRKAFCPQKYHEREISRFYCRGCEICICQVCINTDHKDHAIEPLEKAADGERTNILAGAELMKLKNEVCSDAIRQLEETAAKLEAHITTAKRQVSRVAEQMITAIHQREREAIITLEDIRVSRIEKLDALKEQLQLLAKQINQAAKFATDLVQRSSSSDIMRNKRSLAERFEEIDKTQLPALPSSLFVKFVSTSEPNMLNLGFIRTNDTDPNRSTVEGLKRTFQAGVEVEFSICPKTHEGQISNKQHEDQVEVLVDPADQLASLIVKEEPGGDFRVKFVPKLPGFYYISAKLNGENLAQSPFTIEVKERRIKLVGELDLQNIKEPTGISVNSKELIAVADYDKNCILIFDKEGKFVRQLGCYGKNPGELDYPVDVTFMNDDEILVAEESNRRVQQLNVHTGNYVNSFGQYGTGDGEFKDPVSVCMDDQGRIVVAEDYNNRLQVLTKDGTSVLKFGDTGSEKLNFPKGCVCYKNMLFVTDNKNGCVKVFDSSGRFLRRIGEKGKADGQFTKPWGLCVDTHGNLLVSDYGAGHVQQFTTEGHFTGKTVAELQGPEGIATMLDGRILISEYDAGKVLILK